MRPHAEPRADRLVPCRERAEHPESRLRFPQDWVHASAVTATSQPAPSRTGASRPTFARVSTTLPDDCHPLPTPAAPSLRVVATGAPPRSGRNRIVALDVFRGLM